MDKQEKQKKPKRRWGLVALIAGAAILADVTNMPSKMINTYSNVKEGVYNIFTKSDEEKVIDYYEATNEYFSALPSEKKNELFTNYINNDTTFNYVHFIDGVKKERLSPIISRISESDSIKKDPTWVISLYKGLEREEKWSVVKEMGKDVMGLK